MQPGRCSFLNGCRTLTCVLQFHARIAKVGLDTDPFVAGKLLLHCATHVSGALDYARLFLVRHPDPDTFMFNTVIRGFADSDYPTNSILTLSAMLKNPSCPVDSFSLAFTLKSAANMRCLRTGFQLHCLALTLGLDTHIFVGTTLISMYAECGFVESAKRMFNEIPDPNVVTWNAVVTAFFRSGNMKGAEEVFHLIPTKNLTSYNLMLAGYTKRGEFDLAKKVFAEMPSRDDVSWSTMIAGFSQYGCFDEAFEYFRDLLKAGMRPNEVSLTGVLSACAHAGALEFSRVLHGFIEKMGFLCITPVNNALIDSYSKCGRVDMARLVFETMPGEKSIISWTSMMVGLAVQGSGAEALDLFDEMQESGIRPDGIPFIAILNACSHAGMVDQGSQVFDKMTKVYGVKPDIEHYGCMVDLYSRAGQLSKAYDFATQIPISPNAVIWRTLLGACSFHGNVKLAEQVKERLSEIDPNNSGDHVLLSNIYAVAGKWKDVATVRRSMAELNLSKTPGYSVVEVNKILYTFVANAKQDEVAMEAYEKLKEIMRKLRVDGGYVPEVVSVLHDIEDEEKEDVVVTHSEKLAVAFGMARMAGGSGGSIRIVKNLRVCRDCHTVMKLISKVYQLEIILRDRSRFHNFKNGVCSCRDYW